MVVAASWTSPSASDILNLGFLQGHVAALCGRGDVRPGRRFADCWRRGSTENGDDRHVDRTANVHAILTEPDDAL
jgi:hypothetical protein